MTTNSSSLLDGGGRPTPVSSVIQHRSSSTNNNRIRARSWSSTPQASVSPHRPQQLPIGSGTAVVVRPGPLLVALAVLCVVPLLVISFSEMVAVDDAYSHHARDERLGGVWMPSSPQSSDQQTITNTGRKRPWHNADYTTVAAAMVVGKDDDDPSRRLVAANSECRRHTVHRTTTAAINSSRNAADHSPSQFVSGSATTTIEERLFLEVSYDQVMIAIVLEETTTTDGNDKKESWWIVSEEQHYAIPGSTLQTPISGWIGNNEAPFAAAWRVARSVLLLQEDDPIRFDEIPLVLDAYNIADGNIVELVENAQQQQQWTFLGRYRNLADLGGGFTYTYMLKAPQSTSGAIIPSLVEHRQRADLPNRRLHMPVEDLSSSQNLFYRMSTREIRRSLLQGDFVEIKGAATIGLALQHHELRA